MGERRKKKVVMTPLMVAKERERRNGNMSEILLQASLGERAGRSESRGGEMRKIK